MAQDRSKNSKYLLSSVNNSLKILEILMVRDNISLKELTQITGFDKTSTFKMLYTLQHRGFIEKTGNARYKLSKRLSAYAEAAETRQNITDAARPYIFQLWAATQQTATLSLLNSSGRVVLAGIKLEKDHGSIVGRIGAEMDAYTHAAGKVLLANLPVDVQPRIIQSLALVPHTPKTITDPDVLVALLQELRGEIVVISSEENWSGHTDMAAPYSTAPAAALPVWESYFPQRCWAAATCPFTSSSCRTRRFSYRPRWAILAICHPLPRISNEPLRCQFVP